MPRHRVGRGPLRARAPLRTVRASFPAYGSSLSLGHCIMTRLRSPCRGVRTRCRPLARRSPPHRLPALPQVVLVSGVERRHRRLHLHVPANRNVACLEQVERVLPPGRPIRRRGDDPSPGSVAPEVLPPEPWHAPLRVSSPHPADHGVEDCLVDAVEDAAGDQVREVDRPASNPRVQQADQLLGRASSVRPDRLPDPGCRRGTPSRSCAKASSAAYRPPCGGWLRENQSRSGCP